MLSVNQMTILNNKNNSILPRFINRLEQRRVTSLNKDIKMYPIVIFVPFLLSFAGSLDKNGAPSSDIDVSPCPGGPVYTRFYDYTSMQLFTLQTGMYEFNLQSDVCC